jgi:hypothetical protein
MNINNAGLESFINYKKFHADFNSTSKVAVAGMQTLKRIVDVSEGGALMGALVDTLDMPWNTKVNFKNPAEFAEKATTIYSSMALVDAVSAFDWFLTSYVEDITQFTNGRYFVHASHSAFTFVPGAAPENSHCCSAEAERYSFRKKLIVKISDICSEIGLMDPDINGLMDLFHYFRTMRNCIAHSNGYANSQLDLMSKSSALSTSIAYWNSINRKASPVLPVFNDGDKIELGIYISIYASAVCLRIANRLNYHAVNNLLASNGMSLMASFYALFIKSHPFRKAKYRNAEAAIAHFLAERYYVQGVTQAGVAQEMKRVNLWKEALERFEELF